MKAVALRRVGWSYGEIRQGLGVSKGTLSLWLRDVPVTDEHREALDRRKREAAKRGVQTIKAPGRERERQLAGHAAGQVSALTKSELYIAGVVAYPRSSPSEHGSQLCQGSRAILGVGLDSGVV